ncbi:22638_t:CDS:2, partial [Dentiscutata erythropus]
MFYVHVIVEEPPKVLYESAVNITHIINTGTFKDLLFEIASNQFLERNVLVFGREKKDSNWILLQDGLTDYLQALVQLNFKMVKFLLESITHKRFCLHLLMQFLRDRLYNELIDLFEEKGVGWFSGIQDTKGKIFIEHLSTKSHYNTFYFTSHHKKEKLSQQTLIEHCKLLEYSMSEIWASENCWDEIVPEAFSLTTAMRKYAEHLQKSAQLTYNARHSTTVVRTPNKDSKLIIIPGVLNINSKYKALEIFFIEKDLYEFIEISEFLPSERVEHHRWIVELRLSFPIYLNHYASFNSKYGTETNESYCPSLLLNQEEQECGSNDEWCLVHAAAGGVGIVTVQIAKELDAKVIATCGSNDKLAIAKKFGADYGVNFKDKNLQKQVLQITGKRGVD